MGTTIDVKGEPTRRARLIGAPRGPRLTRSPAPPAPRRLARWVVLALLGAWLVPICTHLLGIDAILPVALLIAVAALLRGGRTLLDRLVLALALLLGAVCVAGLVLSFWPWHLQPVPVAGVAGTVLVLIAALLRRRPSLPRVVPATDLVVLGLTALAAASVLWPFRGLDRGGRLGIVVAGGDLASHFSMVDAMGRVGGYLFLHPQAPGAQAIWSVLRWYPQGLHLTGALLLSFLSSGQPQSPVHELDAFVWFEPATFILLCLSVLWAIRRIAGPAVRALGLLPVAALATGYLLWSDPLMIMWTGFWAELAGLAELAILAALLVRPLHRSREQVMVVVALLVAICFTYFFLLPVAVGLTGGWLFWYRRRLRPVRWYLLTVAVLGAAAGSVMVLANLRDAPAGSHVLAIGSVLPSNDRLLATLGLLTLTGLAYAARRRSVPWWTLLAVPVLSVGFAAAIGGYQLYELGSLMYYYFKAVHIVMITVLIGLAPLALWVGRLLPRPGTPASGRSGVLRAYGAPIGLTLAALICLGPLGQVDIGRRYLDRGLAWDWVGRTAIEVQTTVPVDPDAVTLIWGGRPRGYAAQTSQWANVLWRTNGVSWPGQRWVAFEPQTGLLPAADILAFVEQTAPRRVRFVTDNPQLIDLLEQLRREHPELPLEVLDVPLPR